MIIQGLGSATSLYGALAKTSVQRQELPTPKASSANTVTISSAAKALAATREGGATQSTTAAQERLLKAASSDPQGAEKIAYDMAKTPSTIFYDISGVGGGEPVNKLSSGRIIDDSFKENFYAKASVIDSKRLEIFNSEKAKGTDPVTIISKMIDYTNFQSKDYLEASCWAG